MAFDNLRDRLNQQQGERVFLEAQRRLMDPTGTSLTLIACYALSLVLIMIPISFIGTGIFVFAAFSEHMFAIFGGIFLIFMGIVLLPRSCKNLERTLRRDDVPLLYDLLDDIAGAVGTRGPDGVQFTFEMSAFVSTFGLFGRERILTIGVPFWQIAAPQERIALLSHEMVHFARHDSF